MHCLKRRGQQLRASEEAGKDSDCVFKETRCKVAVFLRAKEKLVEMF